MSDHLRYAKVVKTHYVDSAESLTRYLPGNYSVVGETVVSYLIAGEDSAGWTLDDYVIPRLSSGLIVCTELREVAPL